MSARAMPLGFALALLLLPGAARAQAEIEYDRAPEAVLVHYVEQSGEVEDGESWLRITGDGRVRVHHPPHARRGGDYETSLAPAELRQLLRALVARGLLEFDPAAVRADQRAAEAARRGQPRELLASPDADGFTLELALARYAPAPGAPARRDVRKRIDWRALRQDVARYPELRPLADLAAARSELRALLRRGDLRRLAAPEAP